MANEKVKIKKLTDSNDWFNLVDENGREIGVNKGKAPAISKLLSSAKEGDVIEMNVTPKNGKHYGWDIKETDKKKGAPRDIGRETMLDCIGHSCNFYSLKKESTEDQVIAFANKLFDEAMKKSTLPKEGEAK